MIKNGTSAPANPICGRFITHGGVLITLGLDNPPHKTGAQVSRHSPVAGLLIHIAINAIFDPRNWLGGDKVVNVVSLFNIFGLYHRITDRPNIKYVRQDVYIMLYYFENSFIFCYCLTSQPNTRGKV